MKIRHYFPGNATKIILYIKKIIWNDNAPILLCLFVKMILIASIIFIF